MRSVLIGMLGWCSTGCIDFTTDLGEVALDYRIDRARVLGIRLEPPVLMPGESVTVHSLIMAPGGAEPEQVEVALCGLRDDLQVRVWSDPLCFENPDLAEVVSRSLPGTWNAADLTGVPCLEEWDTGRFVGDPDTGFDAGDQSCRSSVPLMVTARFGDQAARGLIPARHRMRPLRPQEPLPVPLHQATRRLTVDGDPVAGGEVELTFTIEDAAYFGQYWWYVDAGDLMSTGLTRMQRVDLVEDDTDTDGPPVVRAVATTNRLRIPADYEGPLRVAVVAAAGQQSGILSGSWYSSGDLTWETVTLQVRP